MSEKFLVRLKKYLDSLTDEERQPFLVDDAAAHLEKVNPELYFSRGMIEGAFETEEYSFDARILSGMLLERINKFNDFKSIYIDSIFGRFSLF